MEGLIKGLINVALGGEEQQGERRRDERDSQSHEERSRSTWAEVIADHDLFFFLFPFLLFYS